MVTIASSATLASDYKTYPVAAAYPSPSTDKMQHPGEFVGSIIAMDVTREGHETETFIYYQAGQAQGHTYVGPLYSAISQYSCTTTWNVASLDQLTAWVKLEQLAAGLRQAYRRQKASARQQGRDQVPALQRLLEATLRAGDQADVHAGAPLLSTPRNHGLTAE